ncbi:MAG TPA: type VII secretion protein EccB [Pilimelia sp.]|nr:type VII secretion protein EccB [Pilimelia sp.]
MPSRQDQLHSYQFAIQRVVAALVMRETDPARSPFRRAAGATLASVLIAVIALGAVAVYGVLVNGGSTRWRDAQAVIVEKETGARYVFRDGRLHPVLNYSSALLAAGAGGTARTVSVSAKSLVGVPRGVPLGIADAPDSLPAAGQLTGDPWSVCATRAEPGAGEGSRSMLLVGAAPSGGAPLGAAGALLRDPAGNLHLAWQNRRHPIRDREVVLAALGWTGQPARSVPAAFLNSLPVGADLELIDIPGRGERVDYLPDARVGQVFVVRQAGGAEQYAVAFRDGLAGVTTVQAQLLLADPRTAARVGQREPTELSPSEFGAARQHAGAQGRGSSLPPTAPELATPEAAALCAVVRDEVGVAEIRLNPQLPDPAETFATPRRTADGGVLADYVVIPPGRGALVEAVAGPGGSGAVSIVVAPGRRHTLPTDRARAALGYGAVRPIRLPAGLVALLPAGSALDPEAAAQPAGRG